MLCPSRSGQLHRTSGSATRPPTPRLPSKVIVAFGDGFSGSAAGSGESDPSRQALARTTRAQTRCLAFITVIVEAAFRGVKGSSPSSRSRWRAGTTDSPSGPGVTDATTCRLDCFLLPPDDGPVPPRPNVERSAETRRKLLDATIDSLVELGWAGTSTTEVVRRAGVSRGAQVHHYPTKSELVLAAVEHLLLRRVDEFAAAFTGLEEERRTPGAALELLWRTCFGAN